jgi:hypothetical protein
MEGFELYKKSSVNASYISLWKNSTMMFNKSALEEYNLYEYKHATLHFNRETNRIGIVVHKEPQLYSYKMSFHKNENARIHLKGFLKYHNINFTHSKKYEFVYDKENNMFVIDLQNHA